MVQYKVLLHQDAYAKVESYLISLKSGETAPGNRLAENLKDSAVLPPATTGLLERVARQNWRKKISPEMTRDFLERLVRTKRPQIFAESQVFGNGQDWNLTELSILGDVAFAVPVTVFDNGRHNAPKVHDQPFEATLLFVAGALLRNDQGHTPADLPEIAPDGELDFDGFYGLYERRLLPSLKYASDLAQRMGKQALVTVPGLGCGLFAGKFKGRLGKELKKVLAELLQQYSRRLPGIKAVYFDPYSECHNERQEIGPISFFIRPLLQGNEDKPQLCHPETYAEEGDDFSNCDLFSIVAWDHVSWPGNDFYNGSRMTDDGVKAAATDSMATMTGTAGVYNRQTYKYEPPEAYASWHDVVRKNGVRLEAQENLLIMSVGPTGQLAF